MFWFEKDGTPVDVVLNPLGVPSRMNPLVRFLKLTLVGRLPLGRQIGDLIDSFHNPKHPVAADMDKLKAKLKDVYGEGEYKDKVMLLNDDQIVEMSNNLRGGGVPMATPVFDGADEADITALLEKAGLNSSGQVTLIDGRTGEAFHRQVTVGYKYVLKLHHLVDDKIHARSIGPYSLVTQQPLGGKAQFGGQPFRRDGGLGASGLRCGLYSARVAHY